MKRVVSGRVLSDTDGRPVLGAIVELSGEGFDTRRMTTNREGVFRFEVPAKPENLRVRDRSGAELYGLANPPEQEIDVVAAVDGANLFRQPITEELIAPEVFDTIRLAVSRFAANPDASLHAIDRMFCGLPPVLKMPELVHLAEGVLRGKGDDMRAFRALLDDLEIWNRRAFTYVRRSLTRKEAEQLLSPAFLRKLVPEHQPEYEPVISHQILALTLCAAMRISSDDPIDMNRNIGILLEQFRAFDPVRSLFRTAREAMFGGAMERRAFSSRMQIFAPVCGDVPDEPPWPPRPGPGDGPSWPPRPGPGDGPSWPPPLPGRPSAGGDPPWPPPPGGSDEPWPGDPCEAEAIEAVREALRRRRSYSIDDIFPRGACPGEVITITGTGLLFEGSTGTVNFPTAVSGSFVPAEPLEWTDTMIRVVVPEGTCDGLLDLEIPGGADTILVCDVELELFVAAAHASEFVGGRTHLLHFTASTGDCLNAGDVVTFSWHGCNVDHAELFIRDSSGHDIADILVLDGTTRHPARYTVPALDRSMTLTARIEVSGPCGREMMETVITVRRSLPIPMRDPFEPAGGSFENFLRNIHRDDLEVAHVRPRPEEGRSALEVLLKAVEVTEAAGDRLGVRGSGCSYTDIVVPVGTTRRMIDPDGMFATSQDLDGRLPGLPASDRPQPSPEVVHVVWRGLRDDLSDAQSVLTPEVLAAYRAVGPVTPLRGRLIHVEAGIKLSRLVCVLEWLGLGMPTLGGGVPQSITGAIGTGTHGSTLRLPPIADFIRAIHLVGPGGHQWWLEPASARITDPDRMRALKREGVLDPCLRVRYDDELFDAALVSFGTAGIIYSVIVETIDTQVYRAQTSQPTWARAREILRTTVLEPPVPEPWFLGITMDPTGRLRLSTLELAPLGTELSENPDSPRDEIVESVIAILAGLPLRLALELPFYVARESLRALNPFEAFRIFRRIRETIEMVGELIRLIRDLLDLLRTHFSGDVLARDEALAGALPNMLNLLWHLGEFMGIGRSTVDEIQNVLTEYQRPTGTFVRQNHKALNWDNNPCPSDTLPANVRTFDNPMNRSVRSSEYIVPADEIIAFTEAIRAVANRVRSGPDALILVINLRFTQRTRALVGMQQFPFSGHVELFTIKGLNGNEEFERLLQPELERFGAVPHWGQLHSPRTNYAALYGERLVRWRRALDVLASASETPNTFRHDFARSRGLLTDL